MDSAYPLPSPDQAPQQKRVHWYSYIFVIIVSLTVFVTLDLNHPDEGLIQVSQEPMQRLLSSMAK